MVFCPEAVSAGFFAVLYGIATWATMAVSSGGKWIFRAQLSRHNAPVTVWATRPHCGEPSQKRAFAAAPEQPSWPARQAGDAAGRSRRSPTEFITMPSFTELSRAQSPLRDAITSAYRRDERNAFSG